jgi:hypothetical protein
MFRGHPQQIASVRDITARQELNDKFYIYRGYAFPQIGEDHVAPSQNG